LGPKLTKYSFEFPIQLDYLNICALFLGSKFKQLKNAAKMSSSSTVIRPLPVPAQSPFPVQSIPRSTSAKIEDQQGWQHWHHWHCA
jgi:hypothetical protein